MGEAAPAADAEVGGDSGPARWDGVLRPIVGEAFTVEEGRAYLPPGCRLCMNKGASWEIKYPGKRSMPYSNSATWGQLALIALA